VEKIARLVNAETYSPSRPIPVAEKQELAREYSERTRIRNAHERDALTAAVYAFRSIQSKLRQIDRKIREEQIVVDRSHLKALVIKGTPINEAIASLTREESEVVEVEPKKTEVEEPLTQDRFDGLRKRYEELEDEQKILMEQIDDLKHLVEYLRFRESELSESLDIVGQRNYWKIKRDRELGKKEQEVQRTRRDNDQLAAEIKNLEKRLELLRGVKRLEIRGDMLAVKIVDKFTQESLEEYMRKVATIKRGDIILFEDASGGGPQTAGLLIEREIRAVIVDTPLSHLAREELVKAVIPVVEASDVELSRIDEFAFISRKKFEKQLEEFLKDVREQARLRGEEQLIEMIEKYRREIER
jgi:predicted RNase H-like nuclease (RuvC/YqgF family)